MRDGNLKKDCHPIGMYFIIILQHTQLFLFVKTKNKKQKMRGLELLTLGVASIDEDHHTMPFTIPLRGLIAG